MSLLIEVKQEANYLPIPEIIQKRLHITKYSKIEFVIQGKEVILQVSNPPVITIERQDKYDSLAKKKRTYTIIRNDFVCQNPRCNKPILKKRGTKKYCSPKCAREHHYSR